MPALRLRFVPGSNFTRNGVILFAHHSDRYVTEFYSLCLPMLGAPGTGKVVFLINSPAQARTAQAEEMFFDYRKSNLPKRVK